MQTIAVSAPRSAEHSQSESNPESETEYVRENIQEAKEQICGIHRGHTHLFTARDQLVDEHRLTILRQLKVYPQLPTL